MSQATENSAGLLVEVLFENLEASKRVEVLAQTLKRTIEQFQDEASVELIRRLHDAFGLDSSLKSVGAEAEERGVYASVIQIERMERCKEFCDLLMAAYPHGSIRKKDERGYPQPKPDFMGTRREILKWVAWEWDGKIDERGKQLFDFLRRAVGSGDDKDMLLEPEKQMVFSVLRARLQCPPLFTEEVLRGWMSYLDETGILWVWEEELYMLLALARVRNGGIANARYDIRLRRDESKRLARLGTVNR